MKKFVNIFIIIVAIIMGAFVFLKGLNLYVLTTDSGWDSSYDSGGWDSGGWDSDSWDSDYDSDWDWSSDSDYSGSGSGTVSVVFLIIFFAIWSYIIGYSIYKTIISSKKGVNVITNYNYLPNLKEEDKTKNNKRVFELTNMDIESLKKELFDIYKDIQISWMNFDYEKMRTLCSDELYNTYKTQLETLNLKGQKNIMENFYLNDIYFLAPFMRKNTVMLTVILKVSQNDYVVDNKTNLVKFGNKNRVMHMTYKLVFEYTKPITNNCPNCNAKISPETSKCDYCDSIIVQGKGKFVLLRKESLDQY